MSEARKRQPNMNGQLPVKDRKRVDSRVGCGVSDNKTSFPFLLHQQHFCSMSGGIAKIPTAK
ncbi:hypothetical protein E2C01_028979 [Portunus trituberculatus]|uniref:Uncharacterized protein n=1 Tax=Portunus trituberculatus TaxID=210409 RepID=A0A5B7ETD3_PORTR|nr:hypothetical protein [Portunus trituberculatus]